MTWSQGDHRTSQNDGDDAGGEGPWVSFSAVDPVDLRWSTGKVQQPFKKWRMAGRGLGDSRRKNKARRSAVNTPLAGGYDERLQISAPTKQPRSAVTYTENSGIV
jgi:hypothetical protein